MLKQKEWIDVIVAKTGCTKKEAKVFYDCVFDYMREQISPEEVIKISGFGVLKLRKTAAKEQINLVTGKAEIVPEHNVVTFKPYFEIDPKPEAIDVEDDYVTEENGEVEIVVPVVDVNEEEVEDEEEIVEEVTEQQEEVVEETPAEEVTEQQEEVVEETPAEEVAEQQEEVVEEDDGFSWVVDGKPFSSKEMKTMLSEKTQLSEADVDTAMKVVKENMKKVGKASCEIKEENDTFDFVITK
jgi:nucleoid DNA-binding protein